MLYIELSEVVILIENILGLMQQQASMFLKPGEWRPMSVDNRQVSHKFLFCSTVQFRVKNGLFHIVYSMNLR